MRCTKLGRGLLGAASMIWASFVSVSAQAQDSGAEAAAAYGRGDYATAAAITKRDCEEGIAAACLNLGVYYENGQGVPKDDAQAAQLYKRACDAGNARGCAGLGNLYFDGKGVGEDKGTAAALYKRSCDAGEAQGCQGLGVMYAHGYGLPEDPAEAAIYFQRACEGGRAEGCRGAGIFYAIGQGVEQDFGHAVALFERGCAEGDGDSCRLVEKAKADAAAMTSGGGVPENEGAAPPAATSASGDVFGKCVALTDLGQSGIQHMWQLKNVCNATIKVVYCFQETFAAAGDTNMCADREYDHRTIASGGTFDFPFSPLPEGTALSDGRVVKNNQFRVAGFACANGSTPDVYFDNGQFLFQHC